MLAILNLLSAKSKNIAGIFCLLLIDAVFLYFANFNTAYCVKKTHSCDYIQISLKPYEGLMTFHILHVKIKTLEYTEQIFKEVLFMCKIHSDNLNGNPLLTPQNIFTQYPNIVTTAQLQEMLGIGRNTALKLLSRGEIKSVKIGKNYKIPKVYVIEYLNKLTKN